MADFTEAIRFEPALAAAYLNRGSAQSAASDDERAIADFSEAIRLGSNDATTDARTYYSRGDACLSESEYGKAIADYGEAIGLDPRFAAAHNNRRWARAISGLDLQQAFEDCNQALQFAPDEASYRDTRGFANLQLGRFDEAIADFDLALKIDPRLASSLHSRGVAKKKGDADIASAKATKQDVGEDFKPQRETPAQSLERCGCE
jgi:tetratricopeptide (TPR) repeat protein